MCNLKCQIITEFDPILLNKKDLHTTVLCLLVLRSLHLLQLVIIVSSICDQLILLLVGPLFNLDISMNCLICKNYSLKTYEPASVGADKIKCFSV